jgi:ubiquitin carboxyl-terminal hydrolase 22/27/51
MPSKAEDNALRKAPVAPCTARRGLLNLGATCYLNVILQSFLHNPLLRAYYLSDKHNWRACDKTGCMSCELDKLFTDVYSPSSSTNSSPGASQQSNVSTGTVSSNSGALGPVSILRTTWENSMDMAGYAQQDAHEFFISVLNQVHASTPGSTNRPSCSCIVHQAFSGQLQSDVKCGKCGFVNPTVDPMMDISLELKSIQGTPGVTSLASCLRRSARPPNPRESTDLAPLDLHKPRLYPQRRTIVSNARQPLTSAHSCSRLLPDF